VLHPHEGYRPAAVVIGIRQYDLVLVDVDVDETGKIVILALLVLRQRLVVEDECLEARWLATTSRRWSFIACTLLLRAPCTNTTSRPGQRITRLSMLIIGVSPTPPLISTTDVLASTSM
jgi:hypothetical protein